jgi:tetratricopeptide (TPR) repeat protein
MSKADQAEKYYREYLHQLYDHISSCYDAVGTRLDSKSDYESSLRWYNESLGIDIIKIESDDLVSFPHINFRMDDYSYALKFCEKALQIQEKLSTRSSCAFS